MNSIWGFGMSNIKDGGAAFPNAEGQANYTGGMTLRDYFASKAMHSYILSLPSDYEMTEFKSSIAEQAFEMADAMLAEREKG